jgi:hypothetical protein
VPYLQLRHAGTNQCLDTVGGRNSDMMQFDCDNGGDNVPPSNPTQFWQVL